MCNILCHIYFPIKDIFNKTSCPITYLLKDNVYTLLYGTAVNPYYGMDVVKSFILNGALFMTIFLPLKHHRTPILSLYGLFSYHLKTGKFYLPLIPNCKLATHIYYWEMINAHSKIMTFMGKLCNMVICMYNKNHSYCSEEQIRIVTSTLLSTHLPRQ